MYQRLSPQGFEVLAFPCNQFGGQEPGTDGEIKAFTDGYGVTFPLFAKVDVNGPNAHPLFAYLKKEKGELLGNGAFQPTKHWGPLPLCSLRSPTLRFRRIDALLPPCRY